jgi:hypothetical protein
LAQFEKANQVFCKKAKNAKFFINHKQPAVGNARMRGGKYISWLLLPILLPYPFESNISQAAGYSVSQLLLLICFTL